MNRDTNNELLLEFFACNSFCGKVVTLSIGDCDLSKLFKVSLQWCLTAEHCMARVGKSSTGRVTWCIMGRWVGGTASWAEQCFVVGLIVKLLFCCGPLLKEICHSSEEFCLRWRHVEKQLTHFHRASSPAHVFCSCLVSVLASFTGVCRGILTWKWSRCGPKTLD